MANEKRLLNAETIARKLKNANCAECNVVRKIQCSACWVSDVLELLEGDSVDAVYVVRCNECKHCVSFDKRLYCNHVNGMLNERTQFDFCSYGERREGE